MGCKDEKYKSFENFQLGLQNESTVELWSDVCSTRVANGSTTLDACATISAMRPMLIATFALLLIIVALRLLQVCLPLCNNYEDPCPPCRWACAMSFFMMAMLILLWIVVGIMLHHDPTQFPFANPKKEDLQIAWGLKYLIRVAVVDTACFLPLLMCLVRFMLKHQTS